MKRREFISGSAAGVAAAAAGMAAGTVASASAGAAVEIGPAPGRSFVFVPGTWHGGWMWRHLRRPLWLAGHEVFTPGITGVGERSHLMSPEVGLETHIQDILNVIEFEELEDVILVGHSFAGITITGVADRLRDRIGRLVFFDALVPTAARPAAIMPDPETGEYAAGWQARMRDFRGGYQMDFFDHYPVEMLVPAEDEANIAWVKRRITRHPVRQWTDPLQLRNGGWEDLPRTYIRCTGQVYSPSSDNMGGPALTEPGWDLIEFPYPRSAMITHPAETVELMLSIAQTPVT
jgi:pimeloyl-ACP methyl ester carboxylesterase